MTRPQQLPLFSLHPPPFPPIYHYSSQSFIEIFFFNLLQKPFLAYHKGQWKMLQISSVVKNSQNGLNSVKEFRKSIYIDSISGVLTGHLIMVIIVLKMSFSMLVPTITVHCLIKYPIRSIDYSMNMYRCSVTIICVLGSWF